MTRRGVTFGMSVLTALGVQIAVLADAEAQDDIVKWRMSIRNRSAHLFSADSDSTDTLGNMEFFCRVGSGELEVSSQVNGNDLNRFAKIIADDLYPKITILKDRSNFILILEKLTFQELGGWRYYFKIDSENAAISNFEKTGSFRFKVASSYDDGIELKNGLEAVKSFRQTCGRRAPAPRP